MKTAKVKLAALLTGLFLVQASSHGFGQTDYFWRDGFSGFNWNSLGPSPWSTVSNTGPDAGAFPVDNDAAFFNQTSGTITSTMDLMLGTGSSQGLRTVTFNSPGTASFTVTLAASLQLTGASGGNQLQLSSNGGATITTSTGNDVGLNTDATFRNSSSSGTLAIADSGGGLLKLNGHVLNLTNTGDGRIVIDATPSGTGTMHANTGTSGGIISFTQNVPGTAGIRGHGSGTVNLLGSVSNFDTDGTITLAGTGTITGNVNVYHGLSPGNALNAIGAATSIGTFHYGGTVTFKDGTNYLWQLGDASGAAGTGWDLVTIASTVTVLSTGTRTIQIENLDPSWVITAGRAYKIIGTTSAFSQANADLFTLAFGPSGSSVWGGTLISSFRLEGRSDGLYLIEIPELPFGAIAAGFAVLSFAWRGMRRRPSLAKYVC